MTDYARPLYESQEDRDNELRIINIFCAFVYGAWGKEYKPHKLKKHLYVDYALTAGKDRVVVAFAEVKRRRINHNKIPAIILSLHKYDALIRLVERGTKGLLVFEFDDGVFYLNISTIKRPKLTINGRKDRGDNQDLEPVIWISRDLWLPVTQAEDKP